MNHCCEPSLGAWDNDCEAYDFIALRNIQKGEELTFDYDTTEFKVRVARVPSFWRPFDKKIQVENFPEKCLCGSNCCRSKINGYLGSEGKVNQTLFHILSKRISTTDQFFL